MAKTIAIFFVLYFSGFILPAQKADSFIVDFSSPESVLNALIHSAKTGDLRILQYLCDPHGAGDGDVKMLCGVSEISIKAGKGEASEKEQEEMDAFITIFSTGKIKGKAEYEKAPDGTELAKVPFWFNHPGGESRSNEEMILVKRYGNWYLLSF